jgi:secreted PhoX family phosphatase
LAIQLSRSQRSEEAENLGRNASTNPTMGEVIAARFHRRDLLKGALAVSAISATMGPLALAAARPAAAQDGSFQFEEIEAGVDENHHVAPGYRADILIRWGDPVVAGAPAFDPMNQTAEAQSQQFGYNNDFVGFIPIDGSAEHGLLVVNHEYTNEELMFPGAATKITKEDKFGYLTADIAAIEMAAHGGSVLEVRKTDGVWRVAKDSPFNRRITVETPMTISGPAAGSDRLKTSADPSGSKVLGMVNNCAGGMTPWGTWLSAEENFHGYFLGKLPDGHAEAAGFKRYGVGAGEYGWGKFVERFDISKEPNEANRFGWMVEIDPADPNSTPVKRTGLGRFKHEGASIVVNKDGRIVVYCGDDERFDYVYKFVSDGTYDAGRNKANGDLLDDGTLHVAKYNDDGSLDWLPLVHGQGSLTEANGFRDQADVLINARLAGDAVGATKMDRPEDIEANPKSGRVYLMLTNNSKRTAEQVDAANPRPENLFGHIVEMTPPDGDHAAARFAWNILVRCGDPSVAAVGATFSASTSKNGWFGMPDNCAIDNQGRLWISTDGNSQKATGRSDGIWAIETEGEGRGTSRHFFRVPVGAEMCGPYFTPDDTTLFLAVQHPGEEAADGTLGTFENPPTRWPDFSENMPVRPALVVVTKEDGGPIA